MVSTLSTLSVRFPTTTPSSAYPSRSPTSFPRQTLEFPPRSPKLSRKATFLPPISAVAVPEKVEKLGNELKNLTLEEARNLVDWLQEELGVSAAAFAPAGSAVAPGAAADGAAGGAAVVEEKTEFDVIIEEVPSNARISTIKAVRAPKSTVRSSLFYSSVCDFLFKVLNAIKSPHNTFQCLMPYVLKLLTPNSNNQLGLLDWIKI